MILTCEACSTQFILDDALIKPGGSKVRCSKCRHVFTAFPAATPESLPSVEIPDPPESGQQDIPFDEPEIQDRLDFNVSQNDDFSINSDSDNQDPGLEETDINFLEIDIDEPEPDFQDDSLELDTQDFEFEDEGSSVPPPVSGSADSDTDTADIEISFSQDEGENIEFKELPFDMDDPAIEDDQLELDIEKDEPPELEFDDDLQADLIIEDDSLPSNEVRLEFDDNEEPDSHEEPYEPDAEAEIEQTVSEQDKFAEYDKVLEQETEPENAGITISDPEVEDNTSAPETRLPPPDDETGTPTEALIDQTPLIPSPSAQSVRQKRGAKKKKGISLPVKILMVLSLLAMAAYVAIISLGLSIPVVSDIHIPVITEWLQPKPTPQPPLNPVPDEPSIDGRFVSNKSAGDLFIVTGRVKNPSNTAVSYIQVKGTLMTKGNTEAGTLTAYCGNTIPEETLKSGNISDITRQMGVKEGYRNTNVNIKPGASVMFMLVFSNLPEDLANFTVAVEGFEPAEK